MLCLKLLGRSKSDKAPPPIELQPSVGCKTSLNNYTDIKKHSSMYMYYEESKLRMRVSQVI